jgi:hypothetical protein
MFCSDVEPFIRHSNTLSADTTDNLITERQHAQTITVLLPDADSDKVSVCL